MAEKDIQQEYEQRLDKLEAADSGTLQGFLKDGGRGDRYQVKTKTGNLILGEFISPPPDIGREVAIVKGKGGAWLFEEPKRFEGRQKLVQANLPPGSFLGSGEIADQLQNAIANAKPAALLGRDALLRQGQRGMVRLQKPYQGKRELQVWAATACNGQCILVRSDQGWIAVGNQEAGQVLVRRDIERGYPESASRSGGKIGYLCLLQVRRRLSSSTADLITWQWVWQLWVGGFTENMIFIKEIDIPPPSNPDFLPTFWDRAVAPEAMIDCRADHFYISMMWIENGDRWWALLKGSTTASVAENGSCDPPMQEVWKKRDTEFSPLPSSKGLTCVGFGYWVSNARQFWLEEPITTFTTDLNNPVKRYALHNGEFRDFTQTVGQISGDVASSNYSVASNYLVPVGWGTNPAFATMNGSNSFSAGQSSAASMGGAPSLFRIAEDGASALISYVSWNASSSSTPTTRTEYSRVATRLNSLDVYESVKDIQAGSNNSFSRYFFPSGVNLPFILRNVEDVSQIDLNQPLQTLVSFNPFRVTTTGHRMISATGLYASGYSFNYTPPAPRYEFASGDWFYPDLYNWAVEAKYAHSFIDVYPNFVAIVPPDQVTGRCPVKFSDPSNRLPADRSLLFKIFPETNSSPPQEPGKTEEERQKEAAQILKNIEHSNRDVSVKLLNSELTGNYGSGEVTVSVFRAKQVLNKVVASNPDERLEQYFFMNASFAAD